MLDPLRDALAAYAKRVREVLRESPPNPEMALAPLFHALLRDALPHVAGGAGLTLLAEFTKPQVGRPDIALKRAGAPAAAFVELKAPDKGTDPAAYRGHDKDQWERFGSLPTWALSNFKEIVLYRRKAVELDVRAIVPRATLDPATSDAKAATLIAGFDPEPFRNLLMHLAQAEPPVATSAPDVAANLAHAARLVRDAVELRLADYRTAGTAGTPLHTVRDEFRDVLYAHPKAGGYPERDFDELFAGAFAQTLAYGLLLAREATGASIGLDAYKAIPDMHPPLRSTVRVLTQDEIVADMGAGFDVMLGTINATDPELLAKPESGRDPYPLLLRGLPRRLRR